MVQFVLKKRGNDSRALERTNQAVKNYNTITFTIMILLL